MDSRLQHRISSYWSFQAVAVGLNVAKACEWVSDSRAVVHEKKQTPATWLWADCVCMPAVCVCVLNVLTVPSCLNLQEGQCQDGLWAWVTPESLSPNTLRMVVLWETMNRSRHSRIAGLVSCCAKSHWQTQSQHIPIFIKRYSSTFYSWRTERLNNGQRYSRNVLESIDPSFSVAFVANLSFWFQVFCSISQPFSW